MCDTFGHNFTPPSPWTQFLDNLSDGFKIGESVEETIEMCDEMMLYEDNL